MTVRFENFTHSFNKNGKPIFAPTLLGRKIGNDLKDQVERAVLFDDFYYHLNKGGHIAALHQHRPNHYFARIDIKNFFYSIARNRVVRALRQIEIDRPEHYGKWSCVKNPFVEPSYSLPYGFVQSPILASLVLMQSAIGGLLRDLAKDMTVAVYVDDISISSNDESNLNTAYERLLLSLADSNFIPNKQKLRTPNKGIDIFNCDLKYRNSNVTMERIDSFRATHHGEDSVQAFERYCDQIKFGNAEVP